MLISKKELLEMTGISYGQLYRWKREGLIPEEWFIKKSTKTGQETFFSKDKIIDRIISIQSLKGRYSLEEMSSFFSGDKESEELSEEVLYSIKQIDSIVLNLYKKHKNILKYMDLIVLLFLSDMRNSLSMNEEQFVLFLNNNFHRITKIQDLETCILILSNNKMIILKENMYRDIKKEYLYYIGDAIQVIYKTDLSELNNNFRKKNKHLFL